MGTFNTVVATRRFIKTDSLKYRYSVIWRKKSEREVGEKTKLWHLVAKELHVL